MPCAAAVAGAVMLGVRGAVDGMDASRPLAWSDVLARQGASKPTAPSADKRGARAREGGISGRSTSSDTGRDSDAPAYMRKVPRDTKPWDVRGQWREKMTAGRGAGNVFGGSVALDDTLAKVPERGTGVGGSWARREPRRGAGFGNASFPQ